MCTTSSFLFSSGLLIEGVFLAGATEIRDGTHGVVNMEGMGFGLLEEEGIKLLCIKYEQNELHSNQILNTAQAGTRHNGGDSPQMCYD